MAKIFAGTDPQISVREQRNMARVRAAAAEGMVLLENNGILPLSSEVKTIALFGSGARRTVKGGTGSGDVNSRSVVSIEQGLEDTGFTITTKDLLDRYEQKIRKAEDEYRGLARTAVEKDGLGKLWQFFATPFVTPDVDAVSAEEIEAAKADAAVYVLARNSGEGKDRTPTEGDYELTGAEKDSIAALAAAYGNVIVVLNVGGVIDTKFLRKQEGIGAVLLMSQAGNVGGLALADVLTGKAVPSGHLATTWAENYLDYPNAANFSHMNGDIDDEYYTEGIYVGYRYFDTFNVTPAYPFGYGKSYTTFEVRTESVTLNGSKVKLAVKVTNTGSAYPGKEVVQVYCSAPQGKLEKPYQQLSTYGKTKLLAPGESETLTLEFPMESVASYDEGKAAWVLEAGNYILRVGTHSRSTAIAAVVTLAEEITTQQAENHMKPDCEMEMLSAKGVKPYHYASEESELAAAPRLVLSPAAITTLAFRYSGPAVEYKAPSIAGKITLPDVMAGKASLDDLVAQLTVREMAELCVGTARYGEGETSVIGNASAMVPGAAGDTTSLMIEDRDIRNMVLADGPAGLRLRPEFQTDAAGNVVPSWDAPFPGLNEVIAAFLPKAPADAKTHYQYCTAIPIATMLAQTWNLPLIEEMGSLVGGEMEEFGVTLWLAPGMNIHRNPLCGRNFEYYSEDPLVSGLCAAADTRGVQRHRGVGTTIKHFAGNSQEDNRMHVNAHISERALREIYLRGFEITVRTAQPLSIMTSYNLINGVHSANNRELITAIARDEWGFEGLVMTDWGTTGGGDIDFNRQYKYSCSNSAGCVWAGNDLTMPGCQADVDEIVRSVGALESSVKYPLTLGELQSCAKHILSVLMRSSIYEAE